MGSWLYRRTGWSLNFAAPMLGACVLAASLVAAPAGAQHADAGAAHPAAPPPPPEEPKPPEPPSGVLPKAIDPSVLSERARASLQERAAGRHASSLPSAKPGLGLAPNGQDSPARLASPATRRLDDEPLRRGEAHQRRVQALETDQGVTLLSNRIHRLPQPRVTPLLARAPLDHLDEPSPNEETVALSSESPHVTETRSLRPGSSRRAGSSTGLGWLLWPFVLFIATGAVLGTLWFRKKTE
jgi:hypothetical protein